MSTRNLFGGFITATLPDSLLDLNDDPYVPLFSVFLSTHSPRSWVQEVPDTQEVFRYGHSNALIIIEVLEKVGSQDDDDPVKLANSVYIYPHSNSVRSTESSLTL